jgi:hypothetical protein
MEYLVPVCKPVRNNPHSTSGSIPGSSGQFRSIPAEISNPAGIQINKFFLGFLNSYPQTLPSSSSQLLLFLLLSSSSVLLQFFAASSSVSSLPFLLSSSATYFSSPFCLLLTTLFLFFVLRAHLPMSVSHFIF